MKTYISLRATQEQRLAWKERASSQNRTLSNWLGMIADAACSKPQVDVFLGGATLTKHGPVEVVVPELRLEVKPNQLRYFYRNGEKVATFDRKGEVHGKQGLSKEEKDFVIANWEEGK